MDFDHERQERLVQNLRRTLPLSAHPRPPLLAFLRARGLNGSGAPRLIVLDVFDAGEDRGLMCRFAIAGEVEGRGFVAPLAQLALERRRAVAPNAVRRRHFCRPGA